jgi:hypothetical protein
MGQGIGYCDLDSMTSICDGDIRFCEKLDALGQQLMKEKTKKYGGDLMGEEREATILVVF